MRVPPGRAGRLWLRERIEAAQRGAQILDQKRHALVQAEREFDAGHARSLDAWTNSMRRAERLMLRAVLLGGEGQVEQVGSVPDSRTAVEVTWRNLMGAAVPDEVRVNLASRTPVAALATSVAMAAAANAYRDALQAAARHAVARRAHENVRRELAATARRQRVVEARLLPRLGEALRSLEGRLAEVERDQATQAKWVSERPGGPGFGPGSGMRGGRRS